MLYSLCSVHHRAATLVLGWYHWHVLIICLYFKQLSTVFMRLLSMMLISHFLISIAAQSDKKRGGELNWEEWGWRLPLDVSPKSVSLFCLFNSSTEFKDHLLADPVQSLSHYNPLHPNPVWQSSASDYICCPWVFISGTDHAERQIWARLWDK